MRIGPSAARQSYKTRLAVGDAHKISTDIRPILPPFLQGAKCPKFWPKFRPQSSSNRQIFELRWFIGKQKQTCQGPMTGLPSYQSWSGRAPQLPEPLAHLVPQRVKVEHFLYILHSSGPRRVQRHQCYTICWGRGCCKKVTVPHLPIRPQQFTGGSPKRVKLENFSVPAAHDKYTATNLIPPIGAVADVKSLPCHISQFAPYISQGGKN